MRKFIWSVFVILIFFPFYNLYGFEAFLSADRTNAVINETFNIKITLKNGDGSIVVPEMEGIEIVSCSTSSNISMINGKFDKTKTYSYTILPVKEGKIKVGPFKIIDGKKSILTNSIIIKVSKSNQTSGETSGLSVKAVLSDSTPYISEYIEYKIIITSDDSVLKIGFDEPEFKGFISERKKNRTYSRIINGRAFQITEIIYSLLPVTAGKGVIPGCRVEASLKDARRRSSNGFPSDSFFGDSFFSRAYTAKRKIIFSNKTDYEIKKLPETDMTSFYTNITGKIDAYAEIDKKDIYANDFINYKIVVEGSGNLSDLKLPEINFSDKYKVYKDKPEIKTHKTSHGERGKIINKYAIVPSKPGNFEIPGMKLKYFNPDEDKWKEIIINKKSFQVKQGKGSVHENIKPEKIIPPAESIKVEKKTQPLTDIIFVKKDKGSFLSKQPDFNVFFKIYFAVGFLMIFALTFRMYFGKINIFSHKKQKKYLKQIDLIENNLSIREKAAEIKSIFNSFLMDKYGEGLNLYFEKNDFENDIKKELQDYIRLLEKIEFSNEISDYEFSDLQKQIKYFIKRL
ncbi:MAG: hypothetical protein CSA18_03700 [Deltaproteobacteria bacterium]|nr:MAG: hypothetical protein CSA18_03700 [Deltaproteobacteria bacterium]